MLRGVSWSNPSKSYNVGQRPDTNTVTQDVSRDQVHDAPNLPACEAMVESIGEVSCGVENAFTAAATALSEGGELFIGLAQTLDDYTSGLEELLTRNTLDSVRDLAERITGVIEAQASEMASLRSIHKALANARRTLTDLSDVVKTIESSISTAQIVETRAGNSVKFSDQLRILALRAREAYARLLAHHESLRGSVRRVEESQNHFVSGHLSRVQVMGNALARLIADFDMTLSNSTRVTSSSSRVLTRTSQRITSAISALQVGDSFRQRLEHLETALAALPESPQARTLVLLIIARQMESAGSALRSELTRLHAGLEGVSRDARQVTASTSQAAGTETESTGTMLADLREQCGAGLAVLYSVQVQRRMLDREFGDLHRTVAAMQEAVAALRDIDKEMQLASYNVLLRSMRSEGLRGAMHVVAMNFSDMTAACSACQRGILRDLDLIRSTASALRRSESGDMTSDLEDLSAKLGALNEALQLSDDLRVALERQGEAGPRALQAFDECVSSMRSQAEACNRILFLGQRLAESLGPCDPAQLTRIPEAAAAATKLRETYSVPEEREVHDHACGMPAPDWPPDPAADGVEGIAPDPADEFEWF